MLACEAVSTPSAMVRFPVRPRGPRPSGARPSSVPALRDVVTKLRSILILAMGKAMEVAERGIAGPEVVEREADAEVEKLGEDAGQAMVLADEGRFGDLEFEAPRMSSPDEARAERTAETMSPARTGAARLSRRSWSPPPAQCVPAGLVQHEGAHAVDQARFLPRTGTKSAGETIPRSGWTPAHESLRPGPGIVAKAGLGLVDQLEPASLDGVREIALHSSRSSRAVSMPGSNSTTVRPPSAFAVS